VWQRLGWNWEYYYLTCDEDNNINNLWFFLFLNVFDVKNKLIIIIKCEKYLIPFYLKICINNIQIVFSEYVRYD